MAPSRRFVLFVDGHFAGMVVSRDEARFVLSAPSAAGLPDHGLAEFAFIGRSNVGKSTLVGSLLGREGLVRTSRTPGRTQLLNLFTYGDWLAIVDLPGYGYAKVSKEKKRGLDSMVQGYLRDRGILRGVVLVVDARRDPVSELDQQVVEWVLEAGRPLLVALTKIDLIPKNRRLHQVRAIERQLGAPADSALPCSGETGLGRDELFRRLRELST